MCFEPLEVNNQDNFEFQLSTTHIQVKWSRPEVLLLLSLYRDREQLFKDKKTKTKTLWEEIARDMRQEGYEYTGSQCETKFKNLKQNYTKTVDHNNVSGNDKKTCPYFEELSEIFGMTPCVKPVAVCSNRATSPTSGFQADACSSNSSGGSLASSMQELSSDNECLPQKEKQRRGKRPAQSKESVVDLFKEYRLEQKLKEEEREKNLKEMHLEKMRRFDRLLDLYEKDISK